MLKLILLLPNGEENSKFEKGYGKRLQKMILGLCGLTDELKPSHQTIKDIHGQIFG